MTDTKKTDPGPLPFTTDVPAMTCPACHQQITALITTSVIITNVDPIGLNGRPNAETVSEITGYLIRHDCEDEWDPQEATAEFGFLDDVDSFKGAMSDLPRDARL